MGSGVKSWILPALAVGATVMTGGAAAPALAGAAGATGAGAAAGAGAAGLGAASAGGLGLAGNALAAQGAAGLLGGAGAAAAGYGATGAGLGSALGTAAASSELPAGMAAYGPNGEYAGATIANDGMTANSMTGGYDSLNPFQRVGQRLSGMDMGGNKGLQVAQKGLGMMKGQEQPQPQGGAAPMPMQRPQQMAGSFTDSSNMNPQELEELKKKAWLQGLGNPNA